jgi:hypothetical protein
MGRKASRVMRSGSTIVVVAALALTGCASSDDASSTISPSPSTTAEPSATPSATSTPTDAYAPTLPPPSPPTLAQLHEQFTQSGQPCDLGVSENFVAGADESAWCAGSTVGFVTFVNSADIDALLQLNADSIEPGLFLVGDHWVVSSEQPDALIQAQTTMGGELWPADSPLFSAE